MNYWYIGFIYFFLLWFSRTDEHSMFGIIPVIWPSASFYRRPCKNGQRWWIQIDADRYFPPPHMDRVTWWILSIFELSTIYENKYKTFTITLFENINYCDSYCFKFRMTEVEGAMLGLCPAHPCCSLLFTHGFPFSDLGIPSQSLRTDIQLRTLTAFQSYDVGYYGAPWPLLCGEIRWKAIIFLWLIKTKFAF